LWLGLFLVVMEQSNTHQDGPNNDNKERKILPMTLKEFEEHARRHVHPVAWRYVSYNAGGLTGRMARRYLDRLKLRPRILRDVSKLDPSVTLCDGTTLPFPLIIAPTAFHRLFHPHGEVSTTFPPSAHNDLLLCISSLLPQGRQPDLACCIRIMFSWHLLPSILSSRIPSPTLDRNGFTSMYPPSLQTILISRYLPM